MVSRPQRKMIQFHETMLEHTSMYICIICTTICRICKDEKSYLVLRSLTKKISKISTMVAFLNYSTIPTKNTFVFTKQQKITTIIHVYIKASNLETIFYLWSHKAQKQTGPLSYLVKSLAILILIQYQNFWLINLLQCRLCSIT